MTRKVTGFTHDNVSGKTEYFEKEKPVQRIKGSVKIELTNETTGEVELISEHENLRKDALADYAAILTNTYTNPYNTKHGLSSSADIYQIKKLLIMFDENNLESEKFVADEGNIVGWADIHNLYNGADLNRGSINFALTRAYYDVNNDELVHSIVAIFDDSRMQGETINKIGLLIEPGDDALAMTGTGYRSVSNGATLLCDLNVEDEVWKTSYSSAVHLKYKHLARQFGAYQCFVPNAIDIDESKFQIKVLDISVPNPDGSFSNNQVKTFTFGDRDDLFFDNASTMCYYFDGETFTLANIVSGVLKIRTYALGDTFINLADSEITLTETTNKVYPVTYAPSSFSNMCITPHTDGWTVFYNSSNKLMRVDVNTGTDATVATTSSLQLNPLAVAPLPNGLFMMQTRPSDFAFEQPLTGGYYDPENDRFIECMMDESDEVGLDGFFFCAKSGNIMGKESPVDIRIPIEYVPPHRILHVDYVPPITKTSEQSLKISYEIRTPVSTGNMINPFEKVSGLGTGQMMVNRTYDREDDIVYGESLQKSLQQYDSSSPLRFEIGAVPEQLLFATGNTLYIDIMDNDDGDKVLRFREHSSGLNEDQKVIDVPVIGYPEDGTARASMVYTHEVRTGFNGSASASGGVHTSEITSLGQISPRLSTDGESPWGGSIVIVPNGEYKQSGAADAPIAKLDIKFGVDGTVVNSGAFDPSLSIGDGLNIEKVSNASTCIGFRRIDEGDSFCMYSSMISHSLTPTGKAVDSNVARHLSHALVFPEGICDRDSGYAPILVGIRFSESGTYYNNEFIITPEQLNETDTHTYRSYLINNIITSAKAELSPASDEDIYMVFGFGKSITDDHLDVARDAQGDIKSIEVKVLRINQAATSVYTWVQRTSLYGSSMYFLSDYITGSPLQAAIVNRPFVTYENGRYHVLTQMGSRDIENAVFVLGSTTSLDSNVKVYDYNGVLLSDGRIPVDADGYVNFSFEIPPSMVEVDKHLPMTVVADMSFAGRDYDDLDIPDATYTYGQMPSRPTPCQNYTNTNLDGTQMLIDGGTLVKADVMEVENAENRPALTPAEFAVGGEPKFYIENGIAWIEFTLANPSPYSRYFATANTNDLYTEDGLYRNPNLGGSTTDTHKTIVDDSGSFMSPTNSAATNMNWNVALTNPNYATGHYKMRIGSNDADLWTQQDFSIRVCVLIQDGVDSSLKGGSFYTAGLMSATYIAMDIPMQSVAPWGTSLGDATIPNLRYIVKPD